METTCFSLVKWYMDCVTDRGEAAIFYCAKLDWRAIHASLGSFLRASSDKEPSTATSLGRFTASVSPSQISIEHPRLKVRGEWQSSAPPFQSTVYEGAEGSVVWDCLQPGSRALLRTADGQMSGLGYAECLTITIPPWRLPLRELRWGRFVSPDHTLIWIDWQGSYSKRLAIIDGREHNLETVSESQIRAGDISLQIAPGRSLRSGRLRSTILPGFAGLRRLFPRSLFNIDEQKTLSPSILTLDGRTFSGWTIHEVVKWEL